MAESKNRVNRVLEVIKNLFTPMKEVIVVIAVRKPNANHFYVVGVYDDIEEAMKAEEIEVRNRGGKYKCIYHHTYLNELPVDDC